jgi:hypothetical protein
MASLLSNHQIEKQTLIRKSTNNLPTLSKEKRQGWGKFICKVRQCDDTKNHRTKRDCHDGYVILW